MDREQFFKVIEIISEHHSTEVVINEAVNGFVGELGRSKWSVTIKECCPSVIEKLIKEGFMLSMTATGLHIDKV